MTEKIDNVNHPAHYTSGFAPVNVECIDITRHLPFNLGNAFKYVWRAGKKGGPEKAVEDLEKALWYLDDHNLYIGGTDGVGMPCARAVFAMLRNDGSQRFRVLREIVLGRSTFAREAIELMIEEEFSHEDNKPIR